MELRDHQKDAIVGLRKSISSGHKRPILVAPCSFGKTIVAGEICKLAVDNGKKVLGLVHRRLLAYQMKDKFKMFSLDSSLIMAGEETNFSAPVQVASAHTLARRLQLCAPEDNPFFHDADIVIVDECHLGISPMFQDIYEFYKDKIIIGLSGTPVTGKGKGLGSVFDDIVETATAKDLEDNEWIVPIRYFEPVAPDLGKMPIVAGDFDKKELTKRYLKITGDVAQNWLKNGGGRKTIVFTTGVKHSVALRDEFLTYGVRAAHLDSRSTEEEREDVMRQFEFGDLDIVLNCRLLTEGFDAPFVSCIVVATATKSFPLWRQIGGRGQRLFNEGFKVDTLLFDHGGNIERHGYLTDDVIWSLDDSKIAWSKPKKKEEKEKKKAKCVACNRVFEGADKCPDCGSPIKTFGRKVEVVEADLYEVATKKATVGDKRRFLGMLKTWVSRQKNPNPRRVLGAFRGRYDIWPHHSYKDCMPIEPDKDFLNYMEYQQIKWAKRKK